MITKRGGGRRFEALNSVEGVFQVPQISENHSAAAQARVAWLALQGEIIDAFDQLWRMPSLPGLEHRSARFLAEWLGGHGFEIETAPGGIPTAFVARRGKPGAGLRLAFLAEYDALPGMANLATSRHCPVPELTAGHACGHNHIAPVNCGAAIAAASLNMDGEVIVVGCPAEEILWGKVALLKSGSFDGCDVILTSHGDYQNGAISRPCQAVVNTEFVFLGEAGHGGKLGPRNALSAGERLITLVHENHAWQKQQVSVKHVIRRGGVMPSITPDEVRLWFTVRHTSLVTARNVYREIKELAERCAAECGIILREQFISECRGYLANDTLAEVLQTMLETVGPPRWSTEDLQFMRDLASQVAPDDPFELDRGLRLYKEGSDYYGQDDGEISWRIPLARANWAYPMQVPIHHWAWTALSGHAAGRPGPLMVSEALALTSAVLLAEPHLISSAKQELAARAAKEAIDEPRLGAQRTMREAPETFWNATWTESL